MFWKQKTVIKQTVEEPPAPMPEKEKTPLEKWNDRFAAYSKLADRIAFGDGTSTVPEDTQKAFRELGDMPKEENNFKIFAGGRIGLEQGIALAQSGAMPWWHLHTGRAFAGDLEGLKRVDDEMKKAGHKISYDAALTWISYPHELVEGHGNRITPAVLQQMMDWGANPNYDNGNWLAKALRTQEEQCLAVFIRAGAESTHVLRVLEELAAEDKTSRVNVIRQVTRGQTLDGRVDDQTLLKATFSPDGAVLKTYFNFAARRVQEVHMSVDKDSAMQGAHFRDYDGGAIEAAQQSLQKLGGKPTPYIRPGTTSFG